MDINHSIIELMLDLAVEIQQVPAATFHEGRRAALLRENFESLGASDVHMDDQGNVFSRLAGSGEKAAIVVSAHLDTVFPEGTDLSIRRTPEKIYGPGIGDNSIGLAGLCALLLAFNSNDRTKSQAPRLMSDIWLVANVGEEGLGNLRGAKAIVDRFGSQPLAYIVLEGMALGRIYHRGLGVMRYRIGVHTQGGHSWVDFGRTSAIHELAQLVVRLNALPLAVEPRTSLNVGTITGGTSVNTIAAQASCELDLRSENAHELAGLSSRVLELVEQANLKLTHLGNVEAELIGKRPSGEIPQTHPLVRLAVDCYAANRIQAKLNIGSTDANEPLSRGMPAICIGLTSGGGSHTKGEYIETQPVSLGLGTLMDILYAIDRAGSENPRLFKI